MFEARQKMEVKRSPEALALSLLEQNYKLASTQIDLPKAQADFLIKWGRTQIKDDDLYYDEDGGCGREDQMHCTVLYGLTAQKPSKELKDIVHQTKPFTVTLKGVSLFEQDDHDVVKLDVESEELSSLSSAIRQQCDNENKYPKYVPHVTLAYVKKGRGADLVGEFPFQNGTEISAEFESGELVFMGAGDSEDKDRVVRMPFNRTKNEGSVALRNQQGGFRQPVLESVKQESVQLYKAGLTQEEVAAELGISDSVVCRALKEAGVPARSRWYNRKTSDLLIAEALRLYIGGMTREEVASRLGVGHTSVVRWTNNAGISRSQSEALALSATKGRRGPRGVNIPWQSSKSGRWEFADSKWEAVRMSQLDADETVKSWTKMAQCVPYLDEAGKKRMYAPDFHIEYVNGSTVVEEIKPACRLNDPVVRVKEKAARALFELKGTKYRFVTEEQLGVDDIENFSLEGFASITEEERDRRRNERRAKAARDRRAKVKEIETAANRAATSPESDEPKPTEAQLKSGNYKKGHIELYGLDIAIENAEGSTRSGKDKDGNAWSVTMPAHYGDVRGTEGKDGDAVDVYIGDEPEATDVYIVDQVDAESGKFDEHKCMLAFKDEDQAKATYVKGFSDGKGEKRIGGITTMTVDKFKEWVKSTRAKKPLSAVKEGRGERAKFKRQAHEQGWVVSQHLKHQVPGCLRVVAGEPLWTQSIAEAEFFGSADEALKYMDKHRMPAEFRTAYDIEVISRAEAVQRLGMQEGSPTKRIMQQVIQSATFVIVRAVAGAPFYLRVVKEDPRVQHQWVTHAHGATRFSAGDAKRYIAQNFTTPQVVAQMIGVCPLKHTESQQESTTKRTIQKVMAHASAQPEAVLTKFGFQKAPDQTRGDWFLQCGPRLDVRVFKHRDTWYVRCVRLRGYVTLGGIMPGDVVRWLPQTKERLQEIVTGFKKAVGARPRRRVAEGESKRTIRQVLATQAEKPITLWGPTRPGDTDWSVRITDEKAAWLIRHDYAEAADTNELITDYAYEELDKIANLTEARHELRKVMVAAHAPETELEALGFTKVFAGSREGNGCAAAWEKKTALTKLEVTLSTTGTWLVHSYHWSEPRQRFEQIEWNYRWLPQSGPISTAIDRVQNAHAGFVHEPVQDLFGESVKRSIKQALAAAPYCIARRTRDGYGKPLLGGAWYWTDRGSWSTSSANALKFPSEEEALYAVEAVMGGSCMEDFGVYIETITPVQEGESAKQVLRNINAGGFVIRGRSWGTKTGEHQYWHEGTASGDSTHWVGGLRFATRFVSVAAARQVLEREWDEVECREWGIEVVSVFDAQASAGATSAPVSEGESVKRVRQALDAGEFVIGGYPLGHSDEMRYWREDTGGWARDMKDAERYKGRASVQQAIEAFMGSYWLKKLRIVAVPYTEIDSPKPPVAEAKQSARFRKEMPRETWVVWRAINYNGKSVPVVYWKGAGLGWTRNRVVAKHFISKEDAQQAIPDEMDRHYPGGLQTAKVYWKHGMTETSTRATALATELLSTPALSRSLL